MIPEVLPLRRLFHLLALLTLILGGSAEATRAPQAAALLAPCCCDQPATEAPCPCGMPKGPSTPNCPQPASTRLAAVPGVVLTLSQEAAAATREPAPWPAQVAEGRAEAKGPLAEVRPLTVPFPPPDRLAALGQFRI